MKKFYWIFFFVVVASFTGNAQTFSLLKDINVGSAGSSPSNLTNVNGVLFFSGNDGINGQELWKTNGTAAGTIMIKDINPGVANSSPTVFANVNGIIYFKANDGVHGDELWKSDGTLAGTVMVKDINPGINSSLFNTFSGIAINGLFFFSVNDGTHGYELWKSDGTEAGTIMIKDINTGLAGGYPGNNAFPLSFTEMNGILYFCAIDGSNDGYYGSALWKSDGTAAGTELVKYIGISYIVNVNNTLYFSGSNDTGSSLWKSDGTSAGTVLLKHTGIINSLIDVNGTIFFYTPTIVLWKSDGTTDGTVQVKVIYTAGMGSYSVGYFINVNGKLFFISPHPTGGTEIWKSDGTDTGTVMVKDIYPGTNSSNPFYLTNINGTLYFRATDGVNGNEIWKSDGTVDGTVMVQDIVPGSAGSNPADITYSNGKIFLIATTPEYGRELWVADLNISLPLTLTDFKAQLSANDGLLTWKTSSEQNTSHFEIERSVNGKDFIYTSTIAAAGNSSTEKQYNYIDKNITSLGLSVIYYRLKAIDADGKSTYSKIIAININNKEAVVMIYPNPVHEKATLMISVTKKEKIAYSIIDEYGKTVQQKNSSVNAGSNTVLIETNSLAAGVYTISLSGQYTNGWLKFVKQ
jgi:trimeric autotransporter adhesin